MLDLTGAGVMLLVLSSGAVLLLALLVKLGAMLWSQPPRHPPMRGVLAALVVNLAALLLLWRDREGARGLDAVLRGLEQDLAATVTAWGLLLAAVWWGFARPWRRAGR